MNPVISVVIPNWNGEDVIGDCLESLRKQTFRNFEMIVVDNGSSDSSLDLIKTKYPEVKVISLSENKGFCIAVNTGIKYSQGEFIAILNNDTEVVTNWLEELYMAFENHPEISFCSSKMLYHEQRDKINTVGIKIKRNGDSSSIGTGQPDGPRFEKEGEVFGACAGAAVYRKRLFDDIGLFDESFFAYLDDVDLSYRAQLSGHRCLFVPKAIVYHKKGYSLKRHDSPNELEVLLNSRNSVYCLLKNWPTNLILKNLHWILLRRLELAVRYTIQRIHKGTAIPFIKGKLDAYKNIGNIFKKRKEILSQKKVPDSYIASIMNKEFF
ncbi:MAG TPA: glycosyltransferase family 2 protein [Nitrospinota bacterium]|nr:glycosyltransferase family 2 protein [Nitrospinota bacterium]